MLTVLTGLVASVTHVVTGPDHLAAVTPLAIDSRKRSWLIGLSWGIGHTIGMVLIGLLFILFKELLPVEAISRHSDTIIGVLLVGIGSLAIFRIYRRHAHGSLPHTHFHTKPVLYAHIHSHSHEDSPEHGHNHDESVKQNVFTALFIGTIHGFAGFSHLFAMLPSLALPTVLESVLYLVAFATGTILTMVFFAFILGLVAFQSLVKDRKEFLKWFTLAGGFLAIAVGVLWMIHPV